MSYSDLSYDQWLPAAVAQYADAYGADSPDQEWILSPYDSWERNPHFTGTPGRPEDMDFDDSGDCARRVL